jgi:hypothetical protein
MLSRSSRLAHVTPRVASRPLISTLVALAFLLQSTFMLPLAVRMATETPCWAQIGSAMSNMDHHAMSHMDHQQPATPQLPHSHDRCPICHGPLASFGTLATALILVITLFIAPLVERANCGSLPHRRPGGRFETYRSRAPPASA